MRQPQQRGWRTGTRSPSLCAPAFLPFPPFAAAASSLPNERSCQMAQAAPTSTHPAPLHLATTLPPFAHLPPPSPSPALHPPLPNESSKQEVMSDGTSSPYVHVSCAAASSCPLNRRDAMGQRRQRSIHPCNIPFLYHAPTLCSRFTTPCRHLPLIMHLLRTTVTAFPLSSWTRAAEVLALPSSLLSLPPTRPSPHLSPILSQPPSFILPLSLVPINIIYLFSYNI